MAILSEPALDFAKEHIERFYDSDFFPKPAEFEALWHQWDEVKKELMSKNVSKLWVTPPRAMTIGKPKGGFRVVHQLEPLDAVIYTALAYEAAPSIENARIDASEKVACSYRFNVANGSFFSEGSGWADYESRTEELLAEFSHVLVTDITDFYNQIYLHRLNNAIESSNPALKPFAVEIENFLLTLNSKSSQGVPVGPAASIVMAEAVLIDVDNFLRAQGVAHTRYVDDIRLFANSPRELLKVLEKLTLYLYENHRLTVSSEKTELLDSKAFTEKHFHNHYADEKADLIESLEEFNPYSDDFDEDEFDDPDDELIEAIQKVIKYDHLDLGLARSVIRTARRNSIDVIAEHLLEHFDFFAPVVNDVVLYLHEVTDAAMPAKLRPHLEAIVESPALDAQLVRYWVESYIAQYKEYMASPILRGLIYSGTNIENQAIAAITTRNVAWVRHHKASIYNLGGWGRRAVLNASRVLPSDERVHWLKLFSANTPLLLDRWVAKWVQETA
ncbi:RNA-directed DNA polymerase [Polaromonas sp. YR568]|uniref:RNA-directed DNA polymerase n=1 Tax=Polaromonas sp. YR568 TaxID=1855301 RepID=UPI0031376EDE